MKIDYDAAVAAGAGQYYGQMIVSNMRYEDSSEIQVNQYLAMTFNSPAPVSDTDVNPQFYAWVATTSEVKSVALDTNLYSVSLKLNFAEPHTMDSRDQITIGVNGDLTVSPDTFLNSFVIAADQAPDIQGTVSVKCAPAPDPTLANVAPVITFIRGGQATSVTLAYGSTTAVTLEQGDYSIESEPVSLADLTVAAALVVSPDKFTLSADATVDVGVSFGPVQRTAALDVAIGELTGLSTETLDVHVIDASTGATLAAFTSPTGTTTPLRSLPASGTAQIRIDAIALNNVNYTFNVPDVTLKNALQTVTISDSTVQTSSVPTTGFVKLAISETADVALSQQMVLRLTGEEMSYTQTVDVMTQSTAFASLVKPGVYSTTAPTLLAGGIVYAVELPGQITVASDGSTALNVSITQSANLKVPGFPAYLSFGGCADLTPGNQADFVSARASSVFKYAGNDGAGDASTYLTDDPATTETIQLARDVEAQLGDQPVLPIMISYTCNLSLGDTPTILADGNQHAHSFANLILALNIANNAIDGAHAVPAGFIVNPDFLGACQQANFGPGYAMPVRAPLQTALDHWSVAATIPADITEDIKGYVAAVNWLIRTVAPQVVFGWQVNLWGVGMSEWIYDDTDPLAMAQQTASYIASLSVYSGTDKPHFLAIDRYEADDFTQRAYVNGYCYGPREWARYFDFCEGLSRALKLPVMPWQIPASRTPNTTDQVNPDFDNQHWGTGGSCILGDPSIGDDYHNVNPTILALQFPPAFQADMGDTAEDMFIRSEPFDISEPMYTDFPLRGIFAVLLGGGATTGIVSTVGNPEPWTRNKLNAYMDQPIGFDTPARIG